MSVTQRNNNRSQSTADYEFKKIFIFDNRYSNGTLENYSSPAVTQTLESGKLLFRDAANGGNLSVEPDANYAYLVGVLAIEGSVDVLAAGTLSVSYCDKGTVDGNKLLLPGTDTLDTIYSGLSVKDHLQRIGIHVDTSSVEHTNFDN